MESSKSTNRRRFLQTSASAKAGLSKRGAPSKSVAFLRLRIFMLIVMSWPYLCVAAPHEPKNLQEMINHARELRALIQSDPHRPIYHFVAPEGHILDPNGALYWKGKYHLGPAYVKFMEGKEHLVWGHAVSTDLLHWTQYPTMIDVTKGDGTAGSYN